MLKKTNLKFIQVGIMLVVFMTGGCKMSGTDQADEVSTAPSDEEDGFVQIFDGKTLQDWEGDSTIWRVENGSIVGEITADMPPLKHNTFLIWRGGQTADFELKGKFRISTNGNSGINYRSEELEDISYALKGYQADIDGNNRYTGQNYEERGRTTLAYRGQKVVVNAPDNPTGSLRDHIKNNAWTTTTVTTSLGDSDSLQANIKNNDWNEIHLIVKGNHLQHYINGVLMSDVTDEDTTNRKMTGLLGVQVHVGPPMKVEYQDLQLKQL